jgi:hypothetical protein
MFRRFVIIPFTESASHRKVAIRNLTSLFDAISLRRTKDLLLLPGRQERTRKLEFTQAERFQYEQTKQKMNRRMREHDSVEYAESRFGLFHIQLQLRILCNHGTFQDPFSWARVATRDMQEAALNMMEDSSEMRCSACRQSMPILSAKYYHESPGTACGHMLCPECLEENDNVNKPGRAAPSSCPLCTSQPTKRPKVGKSDHAQSVSQPPPYFRPAGWSSKMTALLEDVQKDLWSTKRSVHIDSRRIPYLTRCIALYSRVGLALSI